VAAIAFTIKVERLKLERETGQDPTATIQSIAEDASRLPGFVYDVPAQAETALLCQSPERLRAASVEELAGVIAALAGEMKKPPEGRRPDRPRPGRRHRGAQLYYPRPSR